MIQRDTPIVHRQYLMKELKRLREGVRLTQQAVADHLEWSLSKIQRIEAGFTNVGVTDLRALLILYGVTDEEEVRGLLDAARAAKKSAWWTPFRPHIAPQLYFFLGYEASASRIRQFQTMTIPGLLQTPDYVESISSAWGNPPEVVQRGVDIRMNRQKIVTADGPVMEFYLDEAVLRRRVGTVEGMEVQLRKLIEVSRLDNVTIRVVPFDSTIHPGLKGPFSLLYLSESPDEFIVVLEEPHRDVLIRDDEAEAQEYLKNFGKLDEVALSEESSVELIEDIIVEPSLRRRA